ncbi:tautomerase family protein [Aquisalimonas lutea]|uniref:tautomerase family protein n=1 Tax=Aquisalimonas lutea TaxID=1327750 RepID=UPI0025B47FC5|nr:tautomerase family protein [Aquisalimonas lutea]MDN3519487.1 tautomerase family protein [Aquisalimonas lutea]
MPTVRVTVPQGDLTEDQKRDVVERLTETVGSYYQEEKEEDIRSFVMVQINETAPGGYAVGGEIIG